MSDGMGASGGICLDGIGMKSAGTYAFVFGARWQLASKAI